MAAATLDLVDSLRIEQGATWTRVFTFLDENDDPIDVTGWEFRGQVRRSYNSNDALAEFSFTASDADNKKVFTITDTETTDIPVLPPTGNSRTSSFYMYDIEAVKEDGTVERLFQGKAEISPEVTR